MIPSAKWFPSGLQDRAAWFANFSAQFSPISAVLGFPPADAANVAADNLVVQFLAETAVTLEAFKDAVRQYRIIITEGEIGDPTPEFPNVPPFSAPSPVDTGIFERLDNLVKRIRVAPAYTDEIGAMLGIIPSQTPVPEGEPKPVVKASESFDDYKFSVNVTRMGFEAFKVQISRNGNGNWQDIAFATSNPCEVTVSPTTPGQPERILVRAILMQKNAPIGQPSDPTYVTVNP